jgi:uncharacterized protein involved in outer membrane biogenesis
MKTTIHILLAFLSGVVVVIIFFCCAFISFFGWVIGAPTYTQKLRAWFRRTFTFKINLW